MAKNSKKIDLKRKKANEREKKRMHSLNSALDKLREHLPIIQNEQKISKIETIRLTIKYINILNELLIENENKGFINNLTKHLNQTNYLLKNKYNVFNSLSSNSLKNSNCIDNHNNNIKAEL